jgi:pSer/pThr/pTyr-binding forkhead associated (FHA) protein
VLVWEAPGSHQGEHWEMTSSNASPRALADSARVFKVEKNAGIANAFPFGVTLGRVDSNDLVLDDNSVSRFHAFLKFDAKRKLWLLGDADSKNGTWLDQAKVAPNQSLPVRDLATLRLGEVLLVFMLPATFVASFAPRP